MPDISQFNQIVSLNVVSDLKPSARLVVINTLNPLIADLFILYMKTKNFHWHVTGAHFKEYHILFDEQADEIFKVIDVLAERVRKLGGMTIHALDDILKMKTLKEDQDKNVTAHQMFSRLMQDNQAWVSHLRKAHQVCDEKGDIATASLLEVYVDEAEKRIWYLCAALG